MFSPTFFPFLASTILLSMSPISCLVQSSIPLEQMGTCDRCDFGRGAAPGLDYRKMVSAGRSHLQQVPLQTSFAQLAWEYMFVPPKIMGNLATQFFGEILQ
jgi:hypothetical protein